MQRESAVRNVLNTKDPEFRNGCTHTPVEETVLLQLSRREGRVGSGSGHNYNNNSSDDNNNRRRHQRRSFQNKQRRGTIRAPGAHIPSPPRLTRHIRRPRRLATPGVR